MHWRSRQRITRSSKLTYTGSLRLTWTKKNLSQNNKKKTILYGTCLKL